MTKQELASLCNKVLPRSTVQHYRYSCPQTHIQFFGLLTYPMLDELSKALQTERIDIGPVGSEGSYGCDEYIELCVYGLEVEE